MLATWAHREDETGAWNVPGHGVRSPEVSHIAVIAGITPKCDASRESHRKIPKPLAPL